MSIRVTAQGFEKIADTSLSVMPQTSDGGALGSTSLMWADLFLASGAVINFNAGDVTITHASNALAFAGASSGYSFDTGVTIATGGLTVTLGGVTVTGNSTITGTLGGLTGLTVVSGGATITAGGVTITAGGLVVNAGRIIEKLTATDVDAQNNTLTVAQIVAGIVVHTSVTGGGTVTTDTAANIIAGATGVGALTADGQCIICYYVNDGDQTLTFAGGSNVTISDTGNTIPTNESAVVVFRRASATTVVAYII